MLCFFPLGSILIVTNQQKVAEGIQVFNCLPTIDGGKHIPKTQRADCGDGTRLRHSHQTGLTSLGKL